MRNKSRNSPRMDHYGPVRLACTAALFGGMTLVLLFFTVGPTLGWTRSGNLLSQIIAGVLALIAAWLTISLVRLMVHRPEQRTD